MLRYSLNPSQSPTYRNLCDYIQRDNWSLTRFKWRADFSEKNFQFHIQAAECLEFKNLLAQLVGQYCPKMMPLTFCINDQNWLSVLNKIAATYYTQTAQVLDYKDHLIWILKPAKLNNGKHIKIIQRLSELEQHYLNPNRMGGEYVLQQYLMHPHLLKGPSKGHKYSIRMFVVLTNYAGAFIFPDGYFNIALQPYQSNEFTDLRAHLTNEHLNDEERNVIQIPTQTYELFKPFLPQIKSIIGATLKALKQCYPKAFICEKERNLAIFGFDFVVDVREKVWLIEANHGPCFPISDDHPLQKNLYSYFWQAFYKSFVLPIAMQQPSKQIQYQLFEAIDF